jgi:hypothetical protein
MHQGLMVLVGFSSSNVGASRKIYISYAFIFFHGKVDLQAINNSFITLVPKVNFPTTLNDLRPISLVNCVVKNHNKTFR